MTTPASSVSLAPAGAIAPSGLELMLRELGEGEGGFSGTGYGRGEQTLDEFLVQCVTEQDACRVPEGRVPQTTFWIIFGDTVAGMLRMRHHLNESVRIKGGHIGYYVAPWARGRGIATEALGLALEELRKHGPDRVLLTTSPGNVASIRVIEAHGGRLAATLPDPDGGMLRQYWIELGDGVRGLETAPTVTPRARGSARRATPAHAPGKCHRW